MVSFGINILCMLKHVVDVEDYLRHLQHALIYTVFEDNLRHLQHASTYIIFDGMVGKP